MAVLPWLERADPGEEHHEHVIKALHTELDGGAPTGLKATVVVGEDQALTVEQRWLIACGQRS